VVVGVAGVLIEILMGVVGVADLAWVADLARVADLAWVADLARVADLAEAGWDKKCAYY
jgi:hypothetical protein